MTFKSTLLSSVLVFLSIIVSAQTLKENVARDFMHLKDLTQKGEYAKLVDMLPEKMFEIVSKDDLIEALRVGMNNKKVKASILDMALLDISTPEKIDNCYYAELRYTTKMSISFIASEVDGKEENEKRSERTIASLANSYGSNNVQYDAAREEFKVLVKNRSFAISTNEGRDWKFINLDGTQRLILEKLLPEKILAREFD